MKPHAVRRIAAAALLDVAADRKAPAAARAQAARTLLELNGDLGKNATPLKEAERADVTTMTQEEMQAELAAWRRTSTTDSE